MSKIDPASLDLRVIKARIQHRMTAANTNAAATSRLARLGNTAVHDILSGKNKNPSVPMLLAIARALDTTLGYLVGEEEFPGVDPTRSEAAAIPIVGIAETGAFRVMAEWGPDTDVELPRIFAPRSRLFPKAKHFALEVRGDSMNAARPRPIVEGMYALCVDIIDAELPIESGRVYAVRRTIDGGQTYECTIKRAQVFRDRIELVPESTNPAHKTITVARDFDVTHTNEIAAIGLVYGTFNSFEDL
jgi:SOS-response transcriptional repressor LexA